MNARLHRPDNANLNFYLYSCFAQNHLAPDRDGANLPICQRSWVTLAEKHQVPIMGLKEPHHGLTNGARPRDQPRDFPATDGRSSPSYTRDASAAIRRRSELASRERRKGDRPAPIRAPARRQDLQVEVIAGGRELLASVCASRHIYGVVSHKYTHGSRTLQNEGACRKKRSCQMSVDRRRVEM